MIIIRLKLIILGDPIIIDMSYHNFVDAFNELIQSSSILLILNYHVPDFSLKGSVQCHHYYTSYNQNIETYSSEFMFLSGSSSEVMFGNYKHT